jgi:hypothetical protein
MLKHIGVELAEHEKHQLLASAVSIHLAKNNIDASDNVDDLIMILGNLYIQIYIYAYIYIDISV